MLVKKLSEAGKLLDLTQTNCLKSGYVIIKRGGEVGEHSTENKEEAIIVLSGKAKIVCEGEERVVGSNSIVYIPRNTKHNVLNENKKDLKYVYVTVKVS